MLLRKCCCESICKIWGTKKDVLLVPHGDCHSIALELICTGHYSVQTCYALLVHFDMVDKFLSPSRSAMQGLDCVTNDLGQNRKWTHDLLDNILAYVSQIV